MIDQYSLKARVYPFVIVLFPLLILGISISFKFDTILTSLSSLGVISIFTYLFSQLGRDLGKKKEKKLWKSWGGAPTTLIMQDSEYIDIHTKKRYTEKLENICPANDIVEDDEKLKYWTKFLISNTRDTKKFRLLFKENISYGFRRNLLGLKPIGIAVLFLTLILNFLINSNWSLNIESISTNLIIANVAYFILLVFWILIVSDNWVKIPAFSYAERLFESIEHIE